MRALYAAILAVLVSVAPAYAVTYTFDKLTSNGNVDVGSQLTVEVTDAGNDQVSFTFYNNVGTASSITDIYFDDGTLLGIASITESTGVAFDDPASPGDLPGGNLASPDFETTEDFSADSNSGPPGVSANGVNASTEWVTITFDLIDGKTFADTIAALNGGADGVDDDLRIGLHVQSIGTTGGSDSYINDPTPVPEPGTLALLGTGLVSLGWLGRRRLGQAA